MKKRDSLKMGCISRNEENEEGKMLERIEDITVLAKEEFETAESDMLFVDTESTFQTQPLVQVFLGISDGETELPDNWQESNVFSGDVAITYEEGIIHTFLSLDFGDQLENGQFLFIKVIAIGEAK
jgi:hypothetical protein